VVNESTAIGMSVHIAPDREHGVDFPVDG